MSRRIPKEQHLAKNECGVCLQNKLYNGQMLPCLHSACMSCLAIWFKLSRRCPFCRRTVLNLQYGNFINLNSPLYEGPPDCSQYKISVRDKKLSLMRELCQTLSRKSRTRKIRRLIYRHNWKLDYHLDDIFGHRAYGPEWYRTHPSDLDRLFYWVHRELRVTLTSKRLTNALWERFCSILMSHRSRDEKTADFVRNELGVSADNAERFLAELEWFESYPNDLEYYDLHCT